MTSCTLYCLIMYSEKRNNHRNTVPRPTISRRSLLAASGVIVVGGLAGCLNQVASSVTDTGSSPAAVFAGTDWNDDDTEVTFMMAPGSPHVSRLAPTVSAGQLGDVELEGWVTSSAVMAQDYNSSRSNKRKTQAGDTDSDSDGDGVGDGSEEDADLVAYLGGEPIVAERFSVCLPDAEVPGGDGSIREAVTPERLFAYLTGQSDGEGRVYAWGKNPRGSSGPDEGGDCDDTDSDVYPGAVCGTTPHFVSEVTEPVSTGGGLVAERSDDGHVVVTVTNTPPSDGGASVLVCPAEGDPFEPEGLDAWGKRALDPPTTMDAQGRIVDLTVAQVMVQPPGCPEMVPALMYVGRGLSDGQLIYSGGWILDDAALYEDSATVLSMAGPTEVVGIECCFDYNGDIQGFRDVMKRSVSGERALRGAQIDSNTVEKFVEGGDAELADDILDVITSRGGETRGDDGETGENYRFVTHVAVDAPVLHLVNAGGTSEEVKFKAGAELSKSVN